MLNIAIKWNARSNIWYNQELAPWSITSIEPVNCNLIAKHYDKIFHVIDFLLYAA